MKLTAFYFVKRLLITYLLLYLGGLGYSNVDIRMSNIPYR